MVAISLYRGNLHRVPDIPRQWLMPNHTISLKDFKYLIRKREKALSRLIPTITTTIATTSNPNPNSNAEQQLEFVGDSGISKQKTIEPPPQCQTQTRTDGDGDGVGVNEIKIERDPSLQQHRIGGDAKDHNGGSDGKGIRDSISCPDNKSAVPPPSQPEIGGNDFGGVATLEAEKEEKQLTLAEPPVEISNDVDLSDREKKKKDLEENLKVLNERKHNLVQMLKQILNAEEEIKRRDSLQASVVRPLIPQQMEAATDMGSNPKQAGNRIGPEANFSGDLEGESEDASNPNTHGRQFHRMRSTSPSTSSPLRKRAHSPLQHTAVPQSTQPGLGVSGHTQPTSAVASSPSRFAPAGPPTSLPPLSVSGIHCRTSSPSPAASGVSSNSNSSFLSIPHHKQQIQKQPNKKETSVVIEKQKPNKEIVNTTKVKQGSKEEAKLEEEAKRVSISLISNGGRRKSFCDSKIELNEFLFNASARIVAFDMPPFMQIHAVNVARKTHDSLEKLSSKILACTLKKEFDEVYGPAWHCIVGTSFGSFVTHSVGGFLYFSIDNKLYFLLFKTTVQKAD
ncbi:Dynein light chain [Thalictrum thalictroides]|uniref:Dynein light chain n=1 Tax=Thalictrum thalictroides TaxID=46969 RepID=A0A7J6W1A5_THATH|nr:Dynein light chain [Thalictrum thalictroides]